MKIFETIDLKERVSQLFKIFETLPTFLVESLFILIGNFHISNDSIEKNVEMNKDNFNYVRYNLN